MRGLYSSARVTFGNRERNIYKYERREGHAAVLYIVEVTKTYLGWYQRDGRLKVTKGPIFRTLNSCGPHSFCVHILIFSFNRISNSFCFYHGEKFNLETQIELNLKSFSYDQRSKINLHFQCKIISDKVFENNTLDSLE